MITPRRRTGMIRNSLRMQIIIGLYTQLNTAMPGALGIGLALNLQCPLYLHIPNANKAHLNMVVKL